jgi:transcriptional regulator with XRE-family HTH domain
MHSGRIELGKRVRALRKQSGRTLNDIAGETALSVATLSKIENGAIAVTFDTLMKLAEVLGVPPTGLLSEGAPLSEKDTRPRGLRSVTRRGQGEVYAENQYIYEVLGADLSAKKMLPMVAIIRSGATAGPHDMIRHPGEEFIMVLQGRVELRTEFYAPLVLEPGDSTYFDSTMGHSLVAIGAEDARVLWVSTNGAGAAAHAEQPRFVRSGELMNEKVS